MVVSSLLFSSRRSLTCKALLWAVRRVDTLVAELASAFLQRVQLTARPAPQARRLPQRSGSGAASAICFDRASRSGCWRKRGVLQSGELRA
eukprot:1450624-Prymnesium_polylepis.1